MARKKNPDTTMLLIGGAVAAAGIWYFFLRGKGKAAAPAAKGITMGTAYTSQIVKGKPGPSNTGSKPILAIDPKNGLFLKKNLSGAPVCWNFQGNRAPTSSCDHLVKSLELAGVGSLGSNGLGSLGGCGLGSLGAC